MCSLHRTLLLFLLPQLLLLAGCMDLRPDPAGQTAPTLDSQFSLFNPADTVTQPWWLSLGNSELNQLITDGLSGNLSLQESWARLEQTRALAAKAGAGQYPDLWLDGTAAQLRADSSQTNQLTTDNFALGLSSGYEIDLWGRVRAAVEGAKPQPERLA